MSVVLFQRRWRVFTAVPVRFEMAVEMLYIYAAEFQDEYIYIYIYCSIHTLSIFAGKTSGPFPPAFTRFQLNLRCFVRGTYHMHKILHTGEPA